MGAAFVSLVSSFFTSGQIPNLYLGVVTINWVDLWLIILGLCFVVATLVSPNGIVGIYKNMGNLIKK